MEAANLAEELRAMEARIATLLQAMEARIVLTRTETRLPENAPDAILTADITKSQFAQPDARNDVVAIAFRSQAGSLKVNAIYSGWRTISPKRWAVFVDQARQAASAQIQISYHESSGYIRAESGYVYFEPGTQYFYSEPEARIVLPVKVCLPAFGQVQAALEGKK